MGGEESAVVPTILVADDDPDLLALMARRLVKAGYRVITATDGQQALDMAEHSLPQVAVLDVMMPKLTGIEVLGRLRAHPATRTMPVILITAGIQGIVPSSGLPEGADGFIKKPFGAQELPNMVNAMLDR